jgi:membrane-associated phospholipid phosphatase
MLSRFDMVKPGGFVSFNFFFRIVAPLGLSILAIAQPATLPPSDPPPDRPVSWKRLIPNILDVQKHIWTLPVRLVQGHDLIPTASILGVTGALVAADPPAANYFRGTNSFHGFNNVFTSNATTIGTILAPVSFYAAGLIRHDKRMQETALLAGEALVDAEVVSTVLKGATRRLRPADILRTGNFSDNWYDSKGSALRVNGSFPSGHTIAAFSVATIVARRYGSTHRWVPFVAYGMAGLVGISRLSLSAHYLTDVFVGGALGYTMSRYSVLR